MPFEHVNIQLAIELDEFGNFPSELTQLLTQGQLNILATMTHIQIFKAYVTKFKNLSSNINAGSSNQEDTTRAKRHICDHDLELCRGEYMNLELTRKEFYADRTIGAFYIDGIFKYFSLEDKDRYLEMEGVKVLKETAIPRGRYKVIIGYSNRFKRPMPEILDVPQFTGVRIHDGGLVAEPIDTEGCPIIGYAHDISNHTLLKSKEAFNDFFTILEEALKREEVWIKIS